MFHFPLWSYKKIKIKLKTQVLSNDFLILWFSLLSLRPLIFTCFFFFILYNSLQRIPSPPQSFSSCLAVVHFFKLLCIFTEFSVLTTRSHTCSLQFSTYENFVVTFYVYSVTAFSSFLWNLYTRLCAPVCPLDGSGYFECFVTYELKIIVISIYSLSLNMGDGGLLTLFYSTFDICRMCSVTEI